MKNKRSLWISLLSVVAVAVIALVLIAKSKPDDERHPEPLDYRGTLLITGGMGLLVLGLQESGEWGWGSSRTLACLVVGAALMVGFAAWELRVRRPLLQLKIFRSRGFTVSSSTIASGRAA